MKNADGSATRGARDKLTADKSRAANRRHGSAFEKRLQRDIPGAFVYHGVDGDVAIGHPQDKTHLWMIEAKYRTGLKFVQQDELRLILEQVNR